ncbi:site-2 protease family protein, partial [Candidatus Micrarchaeota archaeon]|nr:site-2 protease family protein [Candidatus Micrarchaeota archaeon]
MNMEKQNWFDTKVWLTAFIMILVLTVIYVFANLNNLTGIQLPVVVTAGISIFLLVLSGYGLGRIWNEKSYYGILLVRSQKLIREIDMLSKKFRSQLTFLADVALVWGTGLFGVYVLYKNCSPRRVVAASVFGFVMLAITILFVLPLVNQLIPYTIKGINYTKAYSQTEREMSGVVVLVSHVLFVIGGFMFSFAFSLLYYAGVTILNTIMVVFSGASPIEPTATAIIPGVSIPLVEGIIALVCLLVVHEVSHGLLARAADVKLTSVGIALLGVLPMGAFVEPDDEELEKRSMIEKVRVFV